MFSASRTAGKWSASQQARLQFEIDVGFLLGAVGLATTLFVMPFPSISVFNLGGSCSPSPFDLPCTLG